MKIQIFGVGRLGSQIAFDCLAFLKPTELWLDDIKELSGDVLDLRHSARGLNLDTKIEAGVIEDPDYVIICAGKPRGPDLKDMKLLEEINKKIVGDIITNKIKGNRKIVMATNPTDVLVDWAKENFKQHEFYTNDKILLKYRDGVDDGWAVVSVKGYSSLAPALSITELIRTLEEGK